jgi:RimJ/RimL family protein N-acetyltransferase
MQGTGLGTVLVRALVDAARRQGIRRFTATVAGENRAVLALLHHVAEQFETGRISRGVREVTVELPAAA